MLSINNLKYITIFFIPLYFIIFTPIKAISTIQAQSKTYTNQKNDPTKSNQKKTSPKLNYNQKQYQQSKEQQDTLQMIMSLQGMSDDQKGIGKYNLAFDYLWEALYLARESNISFQQILIHRRLSKLYELYKLNDASLIQLEQALSVSKTVNEDDDNYANNFISCYMQLAVRQRNLGNYNTALNYLDSCIRIQDKYNKQQISRPYLDAERGNIYLKTGRLNEASVYLNKSLEATKNKDVPYLANINLYMGQLNMQNENYEPAIKYFKESLKLIKSQNGDILLIPDVYMYLSQIYKKQKRNILAYNYLYRSKEFTDSLISLQNNANGELFEIKDSYLNSLKEKDNFIKEQQKELTFQKQIQSRLVIILILGFLLGVTAFLIIRMRLKLKKTILEKKNTELESKLNEEKIKSEMEVKSKELTSYALQMIDKDKIIDELFDTLKKEAPSVFGSLQAKYQKGSKDLWDEFNMRFTEVNSNFYSKLSKKHPDLSPTEQKHLALIKLNFGTKEMARILNITPHSVHISRSRIRKKIGLERTDSLENYIANLED